jgi:ankyrin repeat protein
MGNRPIGQHAKMLRFDWNDPSDRSKYLEVTCLPEIHAAVVNDDWETAEKLLNWKDIRVLWKSSSRRELSHLEQLSSTDKHQQQAAITEMAANIVSNTSVDGAGCVHGCNLLTLALQKNAPIPFLRKLIQLTEKNSFSTLWSADASGRTPLYIAVERGDKEQVALLLEYDANPHILCNFQGEWYATTANQPDSTLYIPSRISAYRHAMDPGKSEIFSLLVEKSLSDWNSNKHASENGPKMSEFKFMMSLQLDQWASRNNEETIRRLGDRFCNLKTILFNAEDCTGTSIVYRQLTNKQPIEKGVEVTNFEVPPDWPIIKAAESEDVETFFNELEILLRNDPLSIQHLLTRIITAFIDHNTEENIGLLTKKHPFLAGILHSIICHHKMRDSDLAYKVFAPLAKAAWPALNLEQKNELFRTCAFQSNQHTVLILSLGDFEFDRNSEVFPHWINRALAYGNRATSEFISKQLDLFGEAKKNIYGFNRLDTIGELDWTKCLLMGILKSGDRRQFANLIIDGLDLKKFIGCDPGILPLMADCFPNEVEDWVAGLNITVTEEMILRADTEAGRSTLRNLIETEKIN